MESARQSSEYVVTGPSQAAVFDHPQRWQILLACAPDELSLSQLRQRFGLSLSKLHYHVGRLLSSGLLEVSRAEPRRGRAVRYYRAIAESFVVPQEFLAALPRDRLERDMREAFRDAALRSDRAIVYSAAMEGRPRVRIREDPDAPRQSPALDLWKIAQLSRAQRVELARELQAVAARYGSPSEAASGEAVLIHLAFVPVTPAR